MCLGLQGTLPITLILVSFKPIISMSIGKALTVIVFTLLIGRGELSAKVRLNNPESREGFVTLLLINEVPFPGEGRYVSVADSKNGMLQILWVLHNRVENTPKGYSQRSIATVQSKSIIDVMAAGGTRGQVDGFYREVNGTPKAVSRVHERVAYLTRIANTGKPGKFAELMNYAKALGEAYFSNGPDGRNLYAKLREIGRTRVTGSGYSWMTDEARFSPGGNYVRIPDSSAGDLAGNRFFTLRKLR